MSLKSKLNKGRKEFYKKKAKEAKSRISSIENEIKAKLAKELVSISSSHNDMSRIKSKTVILPNRNMKPKEVGGKFNNIVKSKINELQSKLSMVENTTNIQD